MDKPTMDPHALDTSEVKFQSPETTEAMIEAGVAAYELHSRAPVDDLVAEIYEAMVIAAKRKNAA